MDTLGSLLAGFATSLTPGNFLVVFLGVVIGTIIGVLPGLGPTASIALLLPATVGMDMVTSLIFLAGIYLSGELSSYAHLRFIIGIRFCS